MKKTIAIVLSAIMVLCLVPFSAFAAEREITAPAQGYAKYDSDEVYEGKYADLSYDQIAGIILDWLDKEIAANTADFNNFEIEVFEGTTVEVPLNIDSIDGILSYSSYLTQLGGDFANLDTTALNGLSRAGGDINLIFGIIGFIADNADTFAKIFAWEEGKTFDFGKVGEYILGLDSTVEENKKLQDFYNNYLIGNNIQEKFLDKIAAESGYTLVDGETADDIINNAIIGKVAEFCEVNGILSAEAIAYLKENFNLRTTDIYTLIKNFVKLIQEDNADKIKTYGYYFFDTVLRTLLKTVFGCTPVIGEEVADSTSVTAEFNAVYSDLAQLYAISGGSVFFRASNGNYYEFTISENGTIASVKSLIWNQTVKIDPPVVAILTGANATTTVKEYRPTSTDYKQYIYSAYAEQIEAEGFSVAGTIAPETYTALMIEQNASPAMSECFGVKVTQGESLISSVVVTFEEIEAMANAIALEKANQMVSQMVDGTTITAAGVKSVDVTLSYNGWATDDEFIVEVTATATAKASVTAYGFTVDQDLDASSFITNPVATFVLDDLSGNLNLGSVEELLELVDTDFVVDDSLFDVCEDYDAYDGVIGQVNHILYKFADMILSDSGMSQIALVDGDNSNLTANMQKVCDNVNELIEKAKTAMNDEGLKDIIAEAGLETILASVNGISADSLFGLDFSSVENLYVSVIGLALDILDDGENELISTLNTALDNADTLDKTAVALTDIAIEKLASAMPTVMGDLSADFGITLGEFSYTVTKTDIATVGENAKEIILEKVADFALYSVTYFAEDVLNAVINGLIGSANEYLVNDLGLVNFSFGVEKGATGEETLEAIADRILFLVDGIIIDAAELSENATVYDKYSVLLNAVIPMGTLLSNCGSDKYDCDLGKFSNIVFGEVLDGDFDNFLALFEAYNEQKNNKSADLAHDSSVNYTLIKTLDYAVDSVLPGAVAAENYTDSASCQAQFTSCDSVVAVVSRSIVALNARKQNILPAVFELLRESDILQSMVTPCSHINTENIAAVQATCITVGYTAGVYCNDCDKYISGHAQTPVDLTAHGNRREDVARVPATCTSEGRTAGVKCLDCGNIISGCETENKLDHTYAPTTVVAPTCTTDGYTVYTCSCSDSYTDNYVSATGHSDADGDYVCDTCSAQLEKPQESFFDRIISFFRSIIEWFKNLFG